MAGKIVKINRKDVERQEAINKQSDIDKMNEAQVEEYAKEIDRLHRNLQLKLGNFSVLDDEFDDMEKKREDW